MGWQPIADGALAERARDVVVAIADAVADVDAPVVDAAVFWTYAAVVLDDDATTARGERAMSRFADALANAARLPGLGLHGGLAGIAWAAAHLADGADELLDAIDAALADVLATTPWPGSYDLIGGLAGIGVYLLERGESPIAAIARARLVERFAELATPAGDAITWRTRAELLPAAQAARFPDGNANCGLAHGVAGAIAVLGKLAARGGAMAATAAALRDGGLRWLVAQQLDGAGGFPSVAGGGPARTAWCYGDPGVTLALWHAGAPIATRDAIAHRWLAQPPRAIHDAGLCHGSAGLAHIANRLFHATGEAAYRDAARGWLADTIARHRPGTGLGGYVMQLEPPGPLAALVDGTIGVGLALIAAISEVEPLWDRTMLCDLPVDQRGAAIGAGPGA